MVYLKVMISSSYSWIDNKIKSALISHRVSIIFLERIINKVLYNHVV